MHFSLLLVSAETPAHILSCSAFTALCVPLCVCTILAVQLKGQKHTQWTFQSAFNKDARQKCASVWLDLPQQSCVQLFMVKYTSSTAFAFITLFVTFIATLRSETIGLVLPCGVKASNSGHFSQQITDASVLFKTSGL